MCSKSFGLLGAVALASAALGTSSPIQDPVPNEAAFERERPRLAKLTNIAGQLHDPKSNAAELITEATKLCGFSIWTENREKVHTAGEDRLGYAITSEEIKWYSQMQAAGHYVRYGDLVNAMDYLYKELGGDGSVGLQIRSTLKASWRHANPSVRAWGTFIKSANEQNPDQEAEFATTESRVSPIEAGLGSLAKAQGRNQDRRTGDRKTL